MTDESSNDYKIGYKRPPLHSRFKAGRSGNPRGRQKGVANLATDVRRMLETLVNLNERGKRRRVPTQWAALLRLMEKALKGDARSLDLLLGLAQKYNNDASVASLEGQGRSVEDRALLDAYKDEVQSRMASADSTTRGDGQDGGGLTVDG